VRFNAQALFANNFGKFMKSIYKQISTTLKKLRIERGWSLDKAAQETGVSKAMLGQIEREESSPTISTLWKIASGFNTSFSSFIENIDTNFEEPVYRAGMAQQIHPLDEKIRVMPLFPFDHELNFEVFMNELFAGCEHLSPPHQKGVIEHVIVIEGSMEVLVKGQWKVLKTGEGLRFHADKPHGYRNLTSKIARFYDIIHYSSNKSDS
jgi:transcriptional regulator with XRE-family HTH domain